MLVSRSVGPDRGRLTRYVDRISILGAPVDFRELCERAVPPETRYVVLDLDRTLHFGRNMGELLGWEICAHQSYGPAYAAELEATRTGGRVYLERSRPWLALRYMLLATLHWGPPGLFYLLWGKIAARHAALWRRSFLRFGPEPVRAIQSIPQHALLHRIASLPLATVRGLARYVWNRYRADQTIDREDLDWLRQRCPGVKIIISSASPQPTLEVSAEELGVDGIVYSSLEEHEGRLSAPCDLRRLTRPEAAPHRISPPSSARINAGRAKLHELHARYPELRDPAVLSVGISDTGYGEDHCWTDAFTRLIDVNSDTPFPPIVPAGARVRSIVSAGLLTRRERDARAAGAADYLDPRRTPGAARADRELEREQLAELLGPVHDAVERLADQLGQSELALAADRAVHEREAERVEVAVEDAVLAFNDAAGTQRARAMRALKRQLARRVAAVRRLARIDRPVSALAFALSRELERARRLLDAPA